MPKSIRRQREQAAEAPLETTLEFAPDNNYVVGVLFRGSFKIGQIVMIKCEETRDFIQSLRSIGVRTIPSESRKGQ